MIFRFPLSLVILASCVSAQAATFDLPPPGEDLIGRVAIAKVREGDTFPVIARRHNLGYREIALANPQLDPFIPEVGSDIVIPMQFVLPPGPRRGIVINLTEMRLYYYPPEDSAQTGVVLTFPLGVGREGWSTPVANTRVTGKKANPTWTPPASIRREHAEKGDPLRRVVQPGPDNPLGNHAIYLGLPAYLLHGTNKPDGIGLKVSHGCIRLFPEDIEQLFDLVDAGTPVRIIEAPYKAGWQDGALYVEAHPPDGDGRDAVVSFTPMVELLVAATRDHPDFPIDWDEAEQIMANQSGLPVRVGQMPKTDAPNDAAQSPSSDRGTDEKGDEQTREQPRAGFFGRLFGRD